MPNYPPIPYSPEEAEPLPPIDTSNPDDARTGFLNTNYEATLPSIRARFPNIDPLYITKIFRGTINPEGLIWMDVDREDASPPDFPDLAHMLYCFEIYGQIICILADPQGTGREIDLQEALADYRIRVLKLSRTASFDSLKAWHKAVIQSQIIQGQDRVEGWRARREDLAMLLKRKA